MTAVAPPCRRQRRTADVIVLRSLLFNLLFYLVLLVLLVASLPTLLMPRGAILGIAKLWGLINLWLLKVVCGTEVEIKGRDKIPSRRSHSHPCSRIRRTSSNGS
jgi:hypothetical protein